MSKQAGRVTTVLLVLAAAAFLVFAWWVGNMTHSARLAAAEFMDNLAAEKTAGLSGSLVELAENLQEFGMPLYSVGKVRLTWDLKARAEIILEQGGRKAGFALSLERRGNRWQPKDAPPSQVSVTAGQNQPLLALTVGDAALTKPLEPMGHDKLLTLLEEDKRAEWLHLGWQDLAEYFTVFFQGKEVAPVVGMDALNLYGREGRVAAAVLTQEYVPDVIRVNINTTGFGGIHHAQVEIACSGRWQVVEAVTGRSLDLEPGSVTLRAQGDFLLMGTETFQHRLIFTPLEAQGKLRLPSVIRAQGVPSYPGTIEVANMGGNLVIVNEVPLEEYLCYVLPGEMPESFGPQALAVQAVVARTYALGNLYASQWRATSAHVVDSVLSQVYNNSGTTAAARAAVESTRGQYLARDGKPALVRYFSTSSGYTASYHEVWGEGTGGNEAFPGTPKPWLMSKAQFPGGEEYSEENYADFIHNPPPGCYDEASPWFRWHFTVPADQLQEIIADNLKSVFVVNEKTVERQNADGKFETVEEIPDDPVGQLLELIPARRGEGGVLMWVDIVGSNGTWRVKREYYIRHVLRPQGSAQRPITLVRHDGSTLNNYSLLPSAHVIWETQGDEALEKVTFYGGGFGHGVGMSQYGVRELARQGWSLEEILAHYFPGTQLTALD
ncbi:MAG: SpoIID/LytB domain-containing protein [Firmicutes bacterium]|nr:SpoIID/LytB domain-containing protein [Bacillota bacterium]